MSNSRDEPSTARQLANAGSIGFAFLLTFGVFIFLGYQFDAHFGWHPWGKIVGLIYGLIGGFYNMWIFAKRYGGIESRPAQPDPAPHNPTDQTDQSDEHR